MNKSNNTYTVGEIIDIRVVFSKIVNVPTTSIPILILNTNPNDSVQLSSGIGTNTLIFNYTVKSGQSTSNLEYTSVNALTGNILDNAGNTATLTLPNIGSGNSLGSNKNIVIDTVLPTITNVTSSSLNGIYKSGDVIPIQISFSKTVTVSGSPSITLNTGKTIVYSSGSGSNVRQKTVEFFIDFKLFI